MRRSARFAPADLAPELLEPRTLLSGVNAPQPLYVSDAAPGGAQSAVIADFNGDNLGDVFLRDQDRIIVSCYIGGGNFAAPMITRVPASPNTFSSVVMQRPYTGDFDGDGDIDALLQAQLTGKHGGFYLRTWFLENDGSGRLTIGATIKGQTPLNTLVAPFNVVTQFDVDGDGGVELITNNNRAIGFENGLLVNKGPVGGVLGTPRYLDFDNDGDTDFLQLTTTPGQPGSPEASTTITLYTNNGASGFTSEALFTIQGHMLPSFSWVDINGDSVKDFLVYGREGDTDADAMLTLIAVPNVAGTFTPVADPLFAETLNELRARGGHAPLPAPWPYVYSASIDFTAISDSFGDARPDILFQMQSTERWDYRPGGAAHGEFAETYHIALVATGSPDASGLPQFVSQSFIPVPTPPSTELPYPLGSIGSGDIDNDGITDYIFSRGEGTVHTGLRLVYAQISSLHLPSARLLQIFPGNSPNPVGSTTVQTGDRLRARLHTIDGDPAHPVAKVSMYIDSNGNGVLDKSDALLRVGVRDTSVGGPTKVWTFNVVRRAHWGASGVRTLFFVPFDDTGAPGSLQTRVINLA